MEIEPTTPMRQTGPDPQVRSRLPEIALAVGLAVMTVVVVRIIYHDSFVDNTTYSNRSFALPGAGFSFLLVVYLSVRLRMIPLWIRLVGAPFAFFAGYLGIGLLLILINAAI
jgi:hypothetical protein